MALPAPNLDDLRFQRDLVDEARRRIVQYCPEWTDYNLSDPGITLIELFAWMTELMVYRLNRVPEKNYIKFMELLGITLQPASSARVDLTFRLSVPFPIEEAEEIVAVVPQYTEVSTRPLEDEPEIIFTTDTRLTIWPPKLGHLRRAVDFAKNYLPRLSLQDCRVFRDQFPQEGDTFYLGFDESHSLAGYILRLTFDVIPTQATGIRRDDPPLVWECSLGNDRWFELTPSRRRGEVSTIGGLNNPTGQIVFYLPMEMKPDEVQGINAHWIRCRFEQRRPSQGTYTRSPRVRGVRAQTIGASVSATHAVLVENEPVGQTSGEPGQTFQLAFAPILDPLPDEVLEVQERVHGEVVFVPWQRVEDFSRSTRYDRHYTLNTATGEIALGPSIRQRDGSTVQYGRIPESGRAVRFTRYRTGGGVIGNVPPNRLNVLRSTIAYIDSVTNLRRAEGGRDAETLEEAKMRVPQELRAQQRAVTAADYEDLARKASRSVARVRCLTPGSGNSAPSPGTVELLVVPACHEALRQGDLTRLHLTNTLAKQIEGHLDKYRLLATTLLVREPAYVGIRVYAEVVAEDFTSPDVVRNRVVARLRTYLSPLPIAEDNDEFEKLIGTRWEGWPFGQQLYVSEIYSIIQKTPGVRHIQNVRVEQRTVVPVRELPPTTEEEISEIDLGLEAPTPVHQSLSIGDDALLCSLDHRISMVSAYGDEALRGETVAVNGSGAGVSGPGPLALPGQRR